MYVFFWVFTRRLIKIAVCLLYVTLYQFHLQRLDVRYEVRLLRSVRGVRVLASAVDSSTALDVFNKF